MEQLLKYYTNYFLVAHLKINEYISWHDMLDAYWHLHETSSCIEQLNTISQSIYVYFMKANARCRRPQRVKYDIGAI